ncbi:murein transglycosylase domain-containing protein [Marinomonas sp.]
MDKILKIVVFFVIISSAGAYALSYEEWKAKKQASYKNYQQEYRARYSEFKNKVTAKWGDKTQLSGQHQYVIYSDDLEQRTILDYQANEIVVESLGDQPANVQKALSALEKTSVNQALAADPVIDKVNINKPSNSLLNTMGATDVDEIAAGQIVETDVAQVDAVDTVNQATSKRINRIRLDLPEDVFVKRAEPFLSSAKQMSEKYDIDQNLILAIAQTESSFNPMAQSPIPAFGLMQIVPTSAGLDVNQALKNKDQTPQASLLFQPDDNIEFGAGYLHLLETRYLKGIEDEKSRLYCMIAAYNTGAGNVASVFHPDGRKVINPAVDVINDLTPEEVYQRLVEDLPYEETQLYLQKVTKALGQYQSASLI